MQYCHWSDDGDHWWDGPTYELAAHRIDCGKYAIHWTDCDEVGRDDVEIVDSDTDLSDWLADACPGTIVDLDENPEDIYDTDEDGDYAVYWETSLDDAGVIARYAEQDEAAAVAAYLNAKLTESHPGNLLCCYAVRELVDGEWIHIDAE